ncbi:MAG: signal peptidase I, partial [Candidatus Dormibacterales bacterium]
PREAEGRRRAGSFIVELAQIAFFAIALYLILNFAIQTVAVYGPSSYPNLEQGDYLIASKLDYRFHAPQRGDFVIIRDPWDSTQNFIKRVIGLPGETVSIRSAHLYINGRVLIEPYLSDTERWTFQANMAPRRLGPHQFFVMGDNRNHSTDSRDFGPVSINDVEAKAWVRVWPFSRFGVLDTTPPRLGPLSAAA